MRPAVVLLAAGLARAAGLLDTLVDWAALACSALPPEAFPSPQEEPEVVVFRRGGSSRHRARDVAAVRARLGDRALVYVPGWGNSVADPAARALVSALLLRESAVLVLDTAPAFSRGYPAAAARVAGLAAALAELLRGLAAGGVRSAHLVGFSLGAHVAGGAARRAGGVARLSALDPAAPCVSAATRVRREDARHVQVLHTSALGVRARAGHVDVFVRGAGGAAARHARAWRVFARSVRGGVRARGERGDWAEVGWGCSNSTRGVYFLRDEPSHGLDVLEMLSTHTGRL